MISDLELLMRKAEALLGGPLAAKLWYMRPNRHLGGKRPVEVTLERQDWAPTVFAALDADSPDER